MRSYAEFRSIEQQLSAVEENPSEALEEATCYVTQMIEYADNVLQGSDDEDLDEEAKEERHTMVYSFVQSYLPSILQKVLKRKLSSPQVRGLAMTFLKEVVRLVVHWIPLDNIYVIKLLVEIAGEDATFYQHRRNSGEYTKYPSYAGAMSPGMDSPLEEVDTGRFTAAPQYYRAPPALLELIEYFGELGGFEKIVERIREEDGKLDLKYATWYLKSGEKLRKWIKRSFLEQWVNDMKDACYSHIMALTPDELKAVTKTVLVRTVELVHVLLAEIMTREEAGCVTETFQLELSLKCLHSKSLEKRLQGLNAINQLIDMATRKESPPSSSYLYGQSMMRRGLPKPTDWLTTDYILAWLKKHEIVAELFGAKMHHELLKRANDIVKLFAEKGEFSMDLLELLWTSSLGKQEATEEAIYLIIRDLLVFFTDEHFLFFFELLRKHPLKEYDTELLLLVQKTSDCTLNKNSPEEIKRVPLEIIWSLMQDKNCAVEEVYDHATQALCSIFETFSSRMEEQRPAFVSLCIENIRASVSVPQSLRLLKVLLSVSAGGRRRAGAVSTEELVMQLEADVQLVALVFEELAKYEEAAKKAGSGTDIDVDTRLLPGFYPHKDHLSTRLSFLTFLMRNYDLDINAVSIEQVSGLWNCLIESPLFNEDRDQAFRWLRDSCEKVLLPQEVVQYVFKHRLMSFDFSKISLVGFSCFERYFRAVNSDAKRLGMGHEPERFVVADFDLEGIDSLWDVALCALDSSVANNAVAYLCKLLDRLSPQLGECQAELRRSYITKLMTKLDEATNLKLSASVDSAEFRILRCLVLLQKLLSDYDAKMSMSRRGYGVPMSVYVKFHDGKYDTTVCEAIYRSDKLSDVRAAILKRFASRLNRDTQTVNLCLRGKILPESDYDKTVQELRIEQTTLLSAKVVDRESDDRQDRRKGNCFFAVDPTDVDSPRLYLSHEEACFTKLFDLLDFNLVVGEKVWELISEIPVNPEKHEAVLHIDDSTNWDELLHTSSTFKLLYMLRIIETITSKPDEEEVAIWYASFLSTKGFERLYYILIHQDELLQGEQRLPCLEALLHLVNSFMLLEDLDAFSLKETFEWIDYPAVVTELIRIIWASAKGGDGARSSDADIVGHSSALLVACMASKPELLETFFTSPGFEDFIRCSILESREQAIRSEMAEGIMLLCRSAAFSESPFKPQPRFVPLFLSFLSSIEPESQVCGEYFDLTNALVQLVLGEGEEDVPSLDLQKLAEELTRLIKDHPIVEDSKHDKVDFVMVGLMQLLSTVLGGSSDVQAWCASLGSGGLVQHVFYDCLFQLPTAEHHGAMAPPKCKSARARQSAFDLLTALVQGNADGYVEVMALINEHHLSAPNLYREWNYSPGNQERAPLGYAGIKNLGCICYMNSLMQQLFMMPNFRRAILSLPIPEDTEQLKKEDNVTYQIQRLFTFLQETQKQCYDPIDLCKSIKDYDGNPTDVFVQMDVDEFFNVLCDKVEQDLKLCGQEKLLENTWSGKVCTQLICQECQHVSERDEPYYTISVDIKNRTNIEEALEQYVQGEMLEGDNAYFCEKCDRKVSALMRRCVKTLPSTLIIHLKRFEFNFDTMRKLKLNDYFEFPMDLDMKAYTKEGLAKKEQREAEQEGKEAPKSDAEEQADEYYDYKLMGILVHRGVADSGHYYSFIQKRGGKPGEEPTWIEFNDDVVLPFDVEDIDRECFGGSEELPISDTMSRHTKVVTRTQNAYMLIYERADAAPKDLAETPPAKQEVAISRKNEEGFAVAAPKPLYEEVWDQNVRFLRDMKVFDKDYFAFNLNLLKVSRIEACLDYERRPVEDFAVIANAVRFLTEILVHSKEKEHVARLVQELRLKLEKHIPACIWVLEQLTEGNRLLTLLLRCTVKETRELVARLIMHVVRVLMKHEEEAFDAEEEWPGQLDPADYLYDDQEMGKQSAVTLRLVEKLLSFFFAISGYWKTFSEFFLLLRDFAKIGPVQREYLFRRQVVPLIYNLFIYGSAFKLRKVPKMGDKLQQPRFANALGVLVTLLQGSPVDRSAVEGSPEEIHELCPFSICSAEDLIEFPPRQLALLFGGKNKLIRKAVLDTHNSAVLCRMLQYLSWNNVENTVAIVELLRVGVNDVEFDQLTPWFALIFPYLSKTDDVLREERIAKLLDGLLTILEKFRNYPKYTRTIITNIFDMYEDCEDIRDILDEQKDRWNWVEGWMIQRHFSCRTFNQPKWSNIGYGNQDRGYDRGFSRGTNPYGL